MTNPRPTPQRTFEPDRSQRSCGPARPVCWPSVQNVTKSEICGVRRRSGGLASNVGRSTGLNHVGRLAKTMGEEVACDLAQRAMTHRIRSLPVPARGGRGATEAITSGDWKMVCEAVKSHTEGQLKDTPLLSAKELPDGGFQGLPNLNW